MSYTLFDPSDYVISADSVTAPAWSSNIPTLSTFFTASTGVSSSFYIDVYNTETANINSAIQFSIAYGHISGSGSAPINTLVPQYTPTRINFGQFRNLIYGDAEAAVNFGQGNTNSPDLIAITVDRNRYKESLFPSTFNLRLTNSANGSVINLTDNSKDVTTITYLDCGRVFNIISGSNGSVGNVPAPAGVTTPGVTVSGSYGLFLPDIGTIVLNPAALGLLPAQGGLGLTMYSGNAFAQNLTNATAIYNAISASAAFQLNSEETISSNYIFVRVKNGEYNYTTNPSIITGSGEFIYSNFINSPQTYPTTVGLYNTNNDLLAVAKLSKPLVKDFTKESLIRVKLDW
jgi:hypothetical protein